MENKRNKAEDPASVVSNSSVFQRETKVQVGHSSLIEGIIHQDCDVTRALVSDATKDLIGGKKTSKSILKTFVKSQRTCASMLKVPLNAHPAQCKETSEQSVVKVKTVNNNNS
jgi:hypothetical protein